MDLVAEEALTPRGREIIEIQEKIFDREKLERIFGGDLVESWGLNWETICNCLSLGDFESPFLRHPLRNLRSAYLRLEVAKKMESDAMLLTSHLLILQALTDELPMQRIRLYTQKFFDKEFSSRTVVSIAEKVKGVQLGVVATVNDGHGPTRFFVKTHSGGSLASRKSSGLEPVLPEELLCYRILELLGVGCKFYFFGRDEKNIYVCTRDASADGEYIEYANLLGKDSDKL